LSIAPDFKAAHLRQMKPMTVVSQHRSFGIGVISSVFQRQQPRNRKWKLLIVLLIMVLKM
jgi:hypothetical protein